MSFDAYPLVSLRDAGVRLIDCVHQTPHAQDEGVPYITIPNLQGGRVNIEGARMITREDMLSWNIKCDITPGDVILSRRCNPGVTAVVPSGFEGSLGQNLVLLRSSGDILDQTFFRWAVRSPQWWNEVDRYINVGAVFDSLRCADIPKFEIPLPPLEDQKVIANILGTIDDKIELNRKTNETLEDIAKALFKSWFVDFDPLRAKAEGRPTGLPDEISELFPDSFEESELGEIPSGWAIAPLDDIAYYLNGLALQKFPPQGDHTDLPVIKIAQLRKGDTIDSDKCSNKLGEEYVIKDGDVLFSWSGSLLVDTWTGGKGALNQHLFKVTSEKHEKWFFYLWTKRYLDDFQAIAESKATTMGHIQRRHLSEAMVLVPPSDCLDQMTRIFAPLLERQIQARLESRNLASIRDALLPKLISGELRVPDAEKMLEEVGI